MTIHADEEMDDDDLTIFDVENVVLTGEIFERQKDRLTNELKHLGRGKKVDGSESVIAVTKFGWSGKLIIITVYVE